MSLVLRMLLLWLASPKYGRKQKALSVSVCPFISGSSARLSASDSPRNVTSALKCEGMLLLDVRLDCAAH